MMRVLAHPGAATRCRLGRLWEGVCALRDSACICDGLYLCLGVGRWRSAQCHARAAHSGTVADGGGVVPFLFVGAARVVGVCGGGGRAQSAGAACYMN